MCAMPLTATVIVVPPHDATPLLYHLTASERMANREKKVHRGRLEIVAAGSVIIYWKVYSMPNPQITSARNPWSLFTGSITYALRGAS